MVETTNQKKCSMLKFFGSSTVPPCYGSRPGTLRSVRWNPAKWPSTRFSPSCLFDSKKKGHMKMDKVWWTLRYVVIHYLYWVVNYYIYIYIIFVGFFLMSDIKVYVWGITNINQQLTADLGWFGGLGTRTPHAPRCREATTSARSWNHFLLLQESGRPVVWQAATKFLAVSRQQ